MTVGEKIQKYRKEKGLSQEELGQMLLVSRQTVSLWEKDKTLPTVDNLKRLKEIFGISVDDILEEGHDDGYKDAPLEKYRFNFDSKEIREIIGLNLRLLISRAMVLAIIVFASWMLYVGMDNADYTMAMAVTVIVGIRYALFIRSFIFMRRKTLFKLSSQTCEYDVYDDYFNVTVIREDEVVYRRKCFFDQISRVICAKNFYLLIIDGSWNEALILKRASLTENSFVYSYEKKKPARVKFIPFQFPLKNVSFISAALTGISVAVFVYLMLSAPFYDMFRGQLWWLFYVLALFPFSMGVIGVLQRIRGERVVFKTVIASVLAICFVAVGFTSSFFGFPNSSFTTELENAIAGEYKSPRLIDVFQLEKDGKHVDNICVWETKSDGLVVGTFYFYYGDQIYYDEYAATVKEGVDYGFLATTSDFFVKYKLYDSVDELPDDYYECRRIEVDGEDNYLCFYYIENYGD